MSGEKENVEIDAALASQDQKTKSDVLGADAEKQSLSDVGGDEALKILGSGAGVELDEAANRRLLRKIGMYKAVCLIAVPYHL